MNHVPDPNFTVETAIRRWVLEACDTLSDVSLVEQLREVILGIAQAHLASGPWIQQHQHLEAEDLASEFLLHLRIKCKWLIRSKAGLKTEYQRWVAMYSNPAHHELWEILSDSLHDLARKNLARRLDAPASENNRNDALWTSVVGSGGNAPCDLVAFQKAACRIKSFKPPGAGKWHLDDKNGPKVIAPSDAKELALALLYAAGGALRFRDLLGEFKRHVFAFEQGGEDDTDQSASPLSIHPSAIQRFHDLAHERAALIWDTASAGQSTDLLCDYFIPKHLEERSVTLEGFGDPRRVHERLQRMVQTLRQHLALNVAEALDVDDHAIDVSFHSRFVIEAMHILCGKCARRPGKTETPDLPIKQTS